MEFFQQLWVNVLNAESGKPISDVQKTSEHKGIELSGTPIDLKSSIWAAKVVPWIGGRIISMTHLPSGNASSLSYNWDKNINHFHSLWHFAIVSYTL